MELLRKVQLEHTRRNAKKPFRRKAYSVVSAMIAKFGLGVDFVLKLETPPSMPKGISFIHGPFKRKRSLDVLPFFLAAPEQHQIATKILEAANNPYVAFACSPDEIILSRHLFAANRDIRPQLLEMHHFETLFLAEVSRARIAALSRIVEDLADPHMPEGPEAHPGEGTAPPSFDSSLADALRGQIKALSEYISFIENPAGSEGDRWPEN